MLICGKTILVVDEALVYLKFTSHHTPKDEFEKKLKTDLMHVSGYGDTNALFLSLRKFSAKISCPLSRAQFVRTENIDRN